MPFAVHTSSVCISIILHALYLSPAISLSLTVDESSGEISDIIMKVSYLRQRLIFLPRC